MIDYAHSTVSFLFTCYYSAQQLWFLKLKSKTFRQNEGAALQVDFDIPQDAHQLNEEIVILKICGRCVPFTLPILKCVMITSAPFFYPLISHIET